MWHDWEYSGSSLVTVTVTTTVIGAPPQRAKGVCVVAAERLDDENRDLLHVCWMRGALVVWGTHVHHVAWLRRLFSQV